MTVAAIFDSAKVPSRDIEQSQIGCRPRKAGVVDDEIEKCKVSSERDATNDPKNGEPL